MKRERQEKILELITESDIETQHALTEALVTAGYPSTQATISRDIRELGLSKEITSTGNYRYTAPRTLPRGAHAARLRTIFRESVTHVAVAQNLIVLQTLPGLASAACSAIDGMHVSGLIGTLAGDDTAFIAMEDNRAAERFKIEITTMLL